MTPTQKSAMLSALRALSCIEYGFIGITDGPSEATTESAMQELEAALAEPGQEPVATMTVQEPVAWMTVRLNVPIQTTARKDVADEWLKWGEVLPLYTAPPRRLAEPVQLEEHCLWARNGNEPCPHAQKVEQDPFLGWLFKRNADGSIGIFAPPPKPGESKRTSDCVGTNQRDLNELLGKLADHMAAAKSSSLQGVK